MRRKRRLPSKVGFDTPTFKEFLVVKTAKTFQKPDLLTELKNNPTLFAEEIMGWQPYPHQAEFLQKSREAKRMVLLWGRQTGKTEVIAVKVIHFAFTHPNSTTLIVSRGYSVVFAKQHDVETEIWREGRELANYVVTHISAGTALAVNKSVGVIKHAA